MSSFLIFAAYGPGLRLRIFPPFQDYLSGVLEPFLPATTLFILSVADLRHVRDSGFYSECLFLLFDLGTNYGDFYRNTIARDVLLAVGQHPDRPGLNHHLLGLKDHFKYVDDNSDLSTLRWDLINPGAFVLKQANMPPIYGYQNADVGNYRSPFGTGPGSTSSSGSGGVHQSSGYSLNAQGEASTRPMYHGSMIHSHPESIRPQGYSTPYTSVGNGTGTYGLSHRPSFSGSHGQSSTQPKSTTAPRTILSPSPEPISRRSENNLDNPNSHSHGGTSSSGYGSQWPAQPQSGSSSSRFGYPPKPIPSTSQSQGGSSSINHGLPQGSIPSSVKAPFRASANLARRPSLHQPQYRQSNLQFSSTANPAASPRSSLQVVVPTSPAKFYGKTHSMTEARPYLSDGTSSSPRRGRPPKGLEPRPINTLPKKRGRPFANKVPVEQTPKKRGRPFKTVESELKAKARASSSGTSTPTTQKKKGRPFKVRHQLFIAQPLPEFHPFKCEWKGCEAELHNLETLRLHLHIVHKKRVEGKVPCLWAKCGAKKVVEGEDGEKKIIDDHPRFASRQAWKDHLEVRHLIPFSWHMGDGPKGTDLCKFCLSSSFSSLALAPQFQNQR